jgi:hypothetical protein
MAFSHRSTPTGTSGQETCSPFDGVMNEFFFEDARRCGGNSTILSAMGFTLPLFSSLPIRSELGERCGLEIRRNNLTQ